MFKRILCLVASILVANLAIASGKINFLNIEADKVYFSTVTEKVGVRPTCANAENLTKWAVSLTSNTGQAIYSMLVTAMAGGMPISVVSANDCADVDGVERPLGVSISPDITSKELVGVLNLYTGDEAIKLGRVVSAANNSEIYFHNLSTERLEYYKFPNVATVNFKLPSCQGEGYSLSPGNIPQNFYHPMYEDGAYLRVNGSSQTLKIYSVLDSSGVCTERNNPSFSTFYPFEMWSHQLCGSSPCKFKED